MMWGPLLAAMEEKTLLWAKVRPPPLCDEDGRREAVVLLAREDGQFDLAKWGFLLAGEGMVMETGWAVAGFGEDEAMGFALHCPSSKDGHSPDLVRMTGFGEVGSSSDDQCFSFMADGGSSVCDGFQLDFFCCVTSDKRHGFCRLAMGINESVRLVTTAGGWLDLRRRLLCKIEEPDVAIESCKKDDYVGFFAMLRDLSAAA
ncbi:hypothetical protein ACLOJK_014687 [Asimina triloba]